MNNGLLLWVDDEVELLKAHIIFLEKKGYQVVTVSNGADAIEQCRQQTFDLILLDEMMPGLSGLETLQQIKDIQPATPVVMCTKSEEEDIMNQAIGSKIADYLIKPVNPNQILLSLKKNIHQREIVSEVTQSSYQQEYQQLAMQIMDSRTWKDWMDIYRRLVKWELELSSTNSPMTEMLQIFFLVHINSKITIAVHLLYSLKTCIYVGCLLHIHSSNLNTRIILCNIINEFTNLLLRSLQRNGYSYCR